MVYMYIGDDGINYSGIYSNQYSLGILDYSNVIELGNNLHDGGGTVSFSSFSVCEREIYLKTKNL